MSFEVSVFYWSPANQLIGQTDAYSGQGHLKVIDFLPSFFVITKFYT